MRYCIAFATLALVVSAAPVIQNTEARSDDAVSSFADFSYASHAHHEKKSKREAEDAASSIVNFSYKTGAYEDGEATSQ
ncbi:hypothetical protein J3459_017947 [Metarhizium acridum]|nr:hypothetical protein J3459_017947 [Metarhizium acridum]